MKLYLETIPLGEQSTISFYTALQAYYNMGFEIEYVENFEGLEIEEEHLFLGGIQFMYQALEKLNLPIPEPLDYPISLRSFLGRKLWTSTINEIARDTTQWGNFVKPKGLAKKFTGRVVNGTKDLVGCGDRTINFPVWVSEPKKFVAEWRTFIAYNRVLSVRMYKGDWRAQYDYKIIEAAVEAYNDAPAAYALDFGLTIDGEFLLVEANDGYSLGNYGLHYIDYAKLLSARWTQLTNQPDLCNF